MTNHDFGVDVKFIKKKCRSKMKDHGFKHK